MGLFDGFVDRIADAVADRMGGNPEAVHKRKYYAGDQKRQLKVPLNKTDDNLIVNLVGLAVDRSVSHVLAGGVEYDLPEGKVVSLDAEGKKVTTKSAQQEYLDAVWEVNKKQLVLLDGAINGAVFGTHYFKMIPDGLTDPYTGEQYPRIVALNPEYLTINTDPQDAQRVTSYVVKYTIGDWTYRETTRMVGPNDVSINEDGETFPLDESHWLIVNEKQSGNDAKWVEVSRQEWPYSFPNIVHGKNLPSLNSVYGSSDIDDILGIQDKSNATVSYIQKQVRLQSFKQGWGRGLPDKVETGPDTFVNMKGENGELGVVDFQTDITGSLAYSKDLRQNLFDVAREVDITSITDKLGALTNFGLRVLYTDALGKCDTKRLLFGETLIELNRRLLVLNGWEGEESRPGVVKWHDPLPVNVLEKFQSQAEELANGTVDQQTIAEENGRDWDTIKARKAEEKANGDNAIGAALLKAFPPVGK